MTEAFTVSTGEEVLFWILAPLLVIGAASLLFSRRTVHVAVSIAGVMIGLAVLYTANEAPFLGVAQIVVYTGAVMMLFLFVIMLVGVSTEDSMSEPLSGQRWWAALAGLGLAALIGAVVTRANLPEAVGLADANADTNPVGVARILFSDFVFPLELTGALLIVAALGAITLTHRVRLSRRIGQPELAVARMIAFGETQDSTDVIGHAGPGVFARHNAAMMPGIDPYGNPVEETVASVLRVRGQEMTPPTHLALGSEAEELDQATASAPLQIGSREEETE